MEKKFYTKRNKANHQPNSVDFIFTLIDEYPVLTKEQELAFSKKKNHDALVLHSLRLAVSLAKKRRGMGIEFADLISEGIVGLIKAAKRYDYKRNVRFSTYAYMYIIREINRAITGKSRMIHLPEWFVATRLREERENRNE